MLKSVYMSKTLGIVLSVPLGGIHMIQGCEPSSEFHQVATKYGDIKCAELLKEFLTREYQLLFELITKVLVLRTEKRTVASATDLFLMQKLYELEEINLPTWHIHKAMTWKSSRHGIPYVYLLNFVFNHLEVPLGRGVPGTTTHVFTVVTLI